MGSAPHQRQGIAAGILATARNFGMVLGVGLSGAIFTSILAQPNGGGIFPAIQTSFMVAIGIALLGVPTSWLRGN
jgi:ABC-type phosphate transport system permease subunit